MKRQKPQRIKLDLLDRNLYIHLLENTGEINQLGRDLQEGWVEWEGDLAGMFIIDDEGDGHIMFIRSLINNKIIVHEAFHATVHMLEDVGQNFDIDNHEIHALLIEHIFGKIEKMFYGPSPKFKIK